MLRLCSRRFLRVTHPAHPTKREAEAARRAELRTRREEDGTGGIEPGSTKHTAFWLSAKSSAKPLLYVSGKIWDVAAFCAHHKIGVNAKCFEVLLCARAGKNKLGNCPSPSASGHKGASDAAHVRGETTP